jgi:hypothetical protein
VPDPTLTYRSWQAAVSTPAPDPEEIAERILASLDLEAPEFAHVPEGGTFEHMGLTGWNMWLWSGAPTEKQWGPVTASASEGGVTVTLTAKVTEMTWDMGNGDTTTATSTWQVETHCGCFRPTLSPKSVNAAACVRIETDAAAVTQITTGIGHAQPR